MKTVKVINKEQPINSPYMMHYTLLYRGREYIETLQGEHKDRYNIGDIIEVEVFRDKGNLSFMLTKVVNIDEQVKTT